MSHKNHLLLFLLDRVDPGDRGGEYRSLLGLPGGSSHPSYSLVEDEATKAGKNKAQIDQQRQQPFVLFSAVYLTISSGFKLVAGKGNDPDTLGKQIVYVYDTKQVRILYYVSADYLEHGPSLTKNCHESRLSFSTPFTREKSTTNIIMTFSRQLMERNTIRWLT